jgi:hypothetical protein
MPMPEAQKSALRDAKAKEKEEISKAFMQGYEDASAKRPYRGYSDRSIRSAYENGYAKGSVGLKVKL